MLPSDEVIIARFPHFCSKRRLGNLKSYLMRNDDSKELLALQFGQNGFDIDVHSRRYP
jgi:hypothetical protein